MLRYAFAVLRLAKAEMRYELPMPFAAKQTNA